MQNHHQKRRKQGSGIVDYMAQSTPFLAPLKFAHTRAGNNDIPSVAGYQLVTFRRF